MMMLPHAVWLNFNRSHSNYRNDWWDCVPTVRTSGFNTPYGCSNRINWEHGEPIMYCIASSVVKASRSQYFSLLEMELRSL